MADYNSLQKRRNVIVGMFVLIAVAAFVWMIFKFGELPVTAQKMHSFELTVNFPSAPGVLPKTPIRFCGFQIGKVTSVGAPQLGLDDQDRPHPFVSVVLAIQNDYKNIPSNAQIRVVERSIGSSFIEIVTDPELPVVPLDPEKVKSAYLHRGMVLEGTMGTANEFFPEEIRDKIDLFVENLTSLTSNLDVIFGDKQNQNNIKDALANIAKMADEAAKTFEEASKTFDQATKTFDSAESFTETASLSVKQVAEDLNDTMRQLNNILAKVNSSDGTVGRLLNDGTLYEDLLDSTQELKLALEQIKLLAAESRENGIRIKL
ncbi:MAG: MCE family protein [Anaerohalosphaera sp.]|nr:MCE family protein [Anaerohalosphaera sp.]